MEARFRNRIFSFPLSENISKSLLLLCHYDNRNRYKNQEKIPLYRHKRLYIKHLHLEKKVYFLPAYKTDMAKDGLLQ